MQPTHKDGLHRFSSRVYLLVVFNSYFNFILFPTSTPLKITLVLDWLAG